MGCISSDLAEGNGIQGNKKRHCIGGLNNQIKEKLRQAIQKDNLKQFVLLMDQNKVLINYELSQWGLFWMATHFCCRWDSQKILQFLLKTSYLEDPMNYLNFINDRTIQGYTCLHLCIIWNAPHCFQMLLRFGGLNLRLKNATGAIPFDQAIRYKKTNFINALKQYEQFGIAFLNIKHEELLHGQIIQLDQPPKDSKKQINVQINDATKNGAHAFQKTEAQIQMGRRRKIILDQMQMLRMQIKKYEMQKAKKEAERMKQVQLDHIKKKQLQFQEKQRQMMQEMKRKQEEAERIKNDLIKAQKEKMKKAIQEENKRIQQIQKAKQAQIQKQLQTKKTVIEQQKQKLKETQVQVTVQVKKPQLQVQKKPIVAEVKTQSSGQCPPALQALYNEAKKTGVFVDKDFPQDNTSIGDAQKAKKFLNDLAWLRPNGIFKGDYHLYDGISADDIKQGSLGVCYMLATLSSLAQYPDKIKNIFVFHDKQIGFYVLRLLIHGQIKHVVLDDALPCSKSTKAPFFAKPNGNQIWVCLVQKAWAKCIGNYMKAQSMTPNHLMQDITTCPSFGGWFKDQIQKTKDIDTHLKQNNIVVLTSGSQKKIQGIVNSHAYSLLNVYQHQGKNIYKVRNPWGKFEWKGQYEDNSPLWTDQLKRKVNFVNSDDGIFYLSETQLLSVFVYYSICIIKGANKFSFVKLKTAKNQNKFYTFELDQDQQINLRFCQQFNRMLNDQKYKYSPVIFEVGRIQADKSITFLTQGDNSCFWGGKSVHADTQIVKKYTKGKYFVRLAVQWENQAKYNTGVFSIYGPKDIKINQIAKGQGEKYWIELLKSFAIQKSKPTKKDNMQYIMSWMRGQMVCYAFGSQTEKGIEFQAKWTFAPQKFQNCTFGLNRVAGTNDIIYKMGKGAKNAGIGTLSRGLINQGCGSGNVFISATSL